MTSEPAPRPEHDSANTLPAMPSADAPAASAEAAPPASPKPPDHGGTSSVPSDKSSRGDGLVRALGLVAVAALLGLLLLWQRVASMQEALAQQAAQAQAASAEALTLSRQAQELTRETAARAALLEGRLAEVSVQRAQLEDLMQSLSRSRDENLVVDIESALRLAQQQAVLTGGTEPLMAALQAAEQRVVRAAQPRLASVQRALARDIEKVKAATFADTPGMLLRLDELVRVIDELPLSAGPPAAGNSRATAPVNPPPASDAVPAFAPWSSSWWRFWGERAQDEIRRLVRVSRIASPEAALVAPEQAFFLRENLKLKLLNARMAVLARQFDGARTDLVAASSVIGRYFDPAARRTQGAQAQLAQLLAQLRQVELPRIDESLGALAMAAGGR